MSRKKLTKAAVERMKPRDKRIEVPDAYCPGLYLIVQPTGRKAWAFRYRLYGRPHKLHIAAYPYYELEDARKAGAQIGKELEDGQDPKLNREMPRKLRRQLPETYREAIEDYHARYQIGQRQNKTAKEIRRTLLREAGLRVEGRGEQQRERVVYPRWIDRPLRDIDGRMIRYRLDEIRDGRRDDDGETWIEPPRPYLANRFYSYLKKFFDWAAEPGNEKVPGSPMAGLSKPWAGEEVRDRVLSNGEIVAIWRGCEELPPAAGAYIRVMLLTGKRKSALAAMRHDQLDVDGSWTPQRSKLRRKENKRTDLTVLPQRAVDAIYDMPLPGVESDSAEELEKLPEGAISPYVFPGRYEGQHIDPGSWLSKRVAQVSGVDDFSFHVVRHTVETKLAELGVQPHIRDMLLDHSTQRGTGKNYDHYQYAPELKEAIETWSAHVGEQLRTMRDEDTPLAKKKAEADG